MTGCAYSTSYVPAKVDNYATARYDHARLRALCDFYGWLQPVAHDSRFGPLCGLPPLAESLRSTWLAAAGLLLHRPLEGDLTPDWLIRLTDWLAYNGFSVIAKRAKVFRRRVADEDGAFHWVSETKGNVDIEMAVDMLALAPRCDTIILFSGERLWGLGQLLELVGWMPSSVWCLSVCAYFSHASFSEGL